MAETKPSQLFQYGDRVRILHTKLRGPIVELRGPLGPGGAQIYRVRVRRKPRPAYIEVREDQLVLIDTETEQPGTRTEDYRATLERRIGQFRGFLQSMNQRSHEVACGSCFMIFEERKPGEQSTPALSANRQRVLPRVLEAMGEVGLLDGPDEDRDIEFPEEGWREDDSSNRFIQFSFEEVCFHLDMPQQTLSRDEAEQILQQRNGFFYLRDRKQFTLKGEDVVGHDPFRKVYGYGDEKSAAEDMAFIFFYVWKFPVDSRFYVSAEAFSGKHQWEQSVPVE
jgi:hypothetical protein